MDCPIPRLEMAIQGRVDFIGEILKAVFGEVPEDPEDKKLREHVPNPAAAAERFIAFVQKQQAQDQMYGRKR